MHIHKNVNGYQGIVEGQSELICRWSPKKGLLFANETYCNFVGKKIDDLLGKNFIPFARKEDNEIFKKDLARLKKQNPVAIHEHRVKSASGKTLWQEWTNRAFFDDKGRPVEFLSVGRDSTDRKKIEEALKKSEGRFRSLFENSPVALIESDTSQVKQYVDKLKEKGISDLRKYFTEHPEDVAHCSTMIKVLDVNNAMLELFEAKRKGEFWGGVSKIFTKKTYHNYIDELVAIGEGQTEFEYQTIAKTLHGAELRVTLKGAVAPGAEKTWSNVLMTVVDVTEITDAKKKLEALNKELTKSNKKLAQLVVRDSHTGLYNHRYLAEIIESEFYRTKRYAHPIAITMMDIDYFKSINDVYGHKFGDLVLKQFAARLQKLVRKHDIVIRFGGEEFLVISPRTDLTGASKLAKRIAHDVNIHSFGNKAYSVKLKLSIAATAYPDSPVAKAMDLVGQAEKILAKAKEAGGDRVYSLLDAATASKKPHKKARAKTPLGIKFLEKKLDEVAKKSNQNLVEAIFAFAKTIELKDHYTGKHVERTVRYATKIAEAMKLSKVDVERIRRAAILHDLGKVGISESILHKKAKLNKKEMDEIKKHPQIGVDIIRPVQYLHDIIPLILDHHEKWDGTGYPHGLKGEDIPVGARIIAVADSYQALTSNRPYRKAFSKKGALKIIRDGSGSHYDPHVVEIFLKVV